MILKSRPTTLIYFPLLTFFMLYYLDLDFRNLRLTDITSSDGFNNNGSMLSHVSDGADTSSVHHQAASLEEASCTNTQVNKLYETLLTFAAKK